MDIHIKYRKSFWKFPIAEDPMSFCISMDDVSTKKIGHERNDNRNMRE